MPCWQENKEPLPYQRKDPIRVDIGPEGLDCVCPHDGTGSASTGTRVTLKYIALAHAVSVLFLIGGYCYSR